MFEDPRIQKGAEVLMEFIAGVVQLKRCINDTADRLDVLVEKAKAGESMVEHQGEPTMRGLDGYYAEFIIQASEGEHGKLVRQLRQDVNDIFERLYNCGGDPEIIVQLYKEVAELKPKFQLIEKQFEDMYSEIKNKKKQIVESN